MSLSKIADYWCFMFTRLVVDGTFLLNEFINTGFIGPHKSHRLKPQDGLGPKIFCYIAKKSTWNTMNFLKLAVNAIHDAK